MRNVATPVEAHMTDTQSFFIDGQAYERLMGRFTRAAGEVFLDWLSTSKGLDWVDVGCGTGAFTQLLLERCSPKRVEAIDPSPEQIAYARKTRAAQRVDFQIGDAQSLRFADRTFDSGVMALVVTFLPDPNKAMTELRRVTKPGGTVATDMWDFLNNGFPQHPLREAVQRMGIEVPYLPGHAHSHMDNLVRYFRSAGLGDIATRVIEIGVVYETFDEYWDAQTALPNYVVQQIRKMAPANVERMKSDLRTSLPKDSSGHIAYKAKANAVKGRVPG
ncbi:MAG: class I SAM-dependent methyltransferase [Candidatus Binataceae bacterium]